MQTREETDTTTAPDEQPSRGRPRWLPMVLLSAGGMAAATVIILLVQARLQQGSNPARLTAQRFPGAIVRLPRWKIGEDERGIVPGHVTYRPPTGKGYLRIAWVPGFRKNLEDLEYSVGYRASEGSKQIWVEAKGKTMPVWTSVMESTGRPLVQSTWLCVRPYVRYFLYLIMDTDAKAVLKTATRILSSVRCDVGTLFGVKMRYLPQLPREDLAPLLSQYPDGSVAAMISGGVFRLMPGHPGRLSREKAAREVITVLRFAFGDRVTQTHAEQVLQALGSQLPGQRAVHSIEGVNQRVGKTRVRWTVFYCPNVDQTFVAIVAMKEGVPPAPHAERLRKLACPAAKTAAEVLVDDAGGPEEN